MLVGQTFSKTTYANTISVRMSLAAWTATVFSSSCGPHLGHTLLSHILPPVRPTPGFASQGMQGTRHETGKRATLRCSTSVSVRASASSKIFGTRASSHSSSTSIDVLDLLSIHSAHKSKSYIRGTPHQPQGSHPLPIQNRLRCNALESRPRGYWTSATCIFIGRIGGPPQSLLSRPFHPCLASCFLSPQRTGLHFVLDPLGCHIVRGSRIHSNPRIIFLLVHHRVHLHQFDVLPLPGDRPPPQSWRRNDLIAVHLLEVLAIHVVVHKGLKSVFLKVSSGARRAMLKWLPDVMVLELDVRNAVRLEPISFLILRWPDLVHRLVPLATETLGVTPLATPTTVTLEVTAVFFAFVVLTVAFAAAVLTQAFVFSFPIRTLLL